MIVQDPLARGTKAVLIALALLMGLNVVMLARSLELLRFPGEITDVEAARDGARALRDYYRTVVESSGLGNNPAVRDALAKFWFEVEQADGVQAIARTTAIYGRSVQDIIAREEDNMRRETVLRIISQDGGIKSITGKASILVSRGTDGSVEIEDEQNVLSPVTRERLRREPSLLKLAETVEVDITDGKAVLATARTMADRLRLLRSEVESLRQTLEDVRRDAGFAPLSGPGIVIEMYDAPGGRSKEEVVQERDVRDVVNELFAAGALGVEVGGQRFIATSSIRSAGALILVNQHPISVNPIVVKAVGDPRVLESSLDLVVNSLKPWGIRIDIRKEDFVRLSAFHEEG